MLELLAVTEKRAVARKYHLTLRGLDSWLYRIRRRRKDLRWYFEQLLSIEKRSDRMRKILLSAQLKTEEERPRIEEPASDVKPQTIYCPFKQTEVPLSTCDVCKSTDWNRWKACQEIKLET